MKILFILKRLDRSGGAIQYVTLANALSKEHEVQLYYFLDQDLVSEISSSIEVKQFPISMYSIPKIQDCIEKFQPQIVHTHTTHADFIGLLAAKKFPNIKTFSSMLLTKFQGSFLDVFYHICYRYLYQKLSPNTIVIANSLAVKRMLMQKMNVNERKIHVLPNAFVYENQPEISLKKFDTKTHKILFVGRLTKAKNIPLLIEAFALLPEKLKENCELILVGKGELQEEINKLITKHKLQQKVFLEGETKSVHSYYKIADVLVLPSLFESFGMVILEAFHHKIPVIASQIDGPAEIIEHQKNGFLFENNNAEALKNALVECLQNPERSREIAEEGFQSLQKYTLENFIQKLTNVYQK